MSGDANGWRHAAGRTAAADLDEYRLVVWKGRAGRVRTFVFHDPVDALAAAVDYLKRGYQVRLGDETVEHFKSQPHAINPAWLPSAADWNLINGVLGRAATMPGFFHADAEPVARARVERLRAQIVDTIDRIARHM
jgi:hypothetical protein